MSNTRKPTRSVSEETQLRELMLRLTDEVLALREENKVNARVIKAELDALKGEATGTRRDLRDVQDKVNDLHHKLIDSSDRLGKRLYDLESERKQRPTKRASRPPRG